MSAAKTIRRTLFSGFCLALALAGLADIASKSASGLETSKPSSLGQSAVWGYQLQGADPQKIHRSDYDMVVIDYSRSGRDDKAFRLADLRKMQKKPGARRLVFAYLSIGEAEDYRYYWSKSWNKNPPEWLLAQNPHWKGNYLVQYWQSRWKNKVFAYLDKIIAAGFDGVYLDRIDAFENFPGRTGAETEMIRFVKEIRTLAQTKRPGFLIIAQNAETLLRHKNYRLLIDGIAKEDLLYGLRGDGKSNSRKEIFHATKYLRMAQRANIPVFVIEYLDNKAQIRRAQTWLRKKGFVPAFSNRPLDQMSTSGP